LRANSGSIAIALLLAAIAARADEAAYTIDLATQDDDALMRVLGAVPDGGIHGVPVAAGPDVDGDGHADLAMAALLASPLGRSGAGEVFLVFGDGAIAGTFDTALPSQRILAILGDGNAEVTGSVVWIDDVTGDGLGDLLIGRQNFRGAADRPGAGALTIIAGGAALHAHALAGDVLDLRAPPLDVAVATLVGSAATARLGLWARTGDVTGDGIADVVVGADQESDGDATHRGAVYVLRGGPQLAATQTVDLADFANPAFPLAGDVARVRPPAGAAHFHFGATCQLADLDGDGRAEVLASAALSRTGAVIQADGAPPASAHSSGGTSHGTLWIAWDENFAADPWPAGYDFAVDDAGPVVTEIRGGAGNLHFGEELVGGRDYDGDGAADLFVGDLTGNAVGRPTYAGLGHLLFAVGGLRGASFAVDAPPPDVAVTSFLGAIVSEIAADTAIDGDFDADGRADLAFSSPHAYPLGRVEAGVLHVFFGRDGAWPATVDLAAGALPPADQLRVTQVLGAHGAAQFDLGDTLGYSAAAADLDGDGKTDLVANEMLGNGATPAAQDAGTLIVLPGARLAPEPGAATLASVALAALSVVGGRLDRRQWRRRLGVLA
jgi:hypothetical protein